MVVMLTPLCQVGAWSQSSKSLKVVDEMRLVEIAVVQREVCPPDGLPSLDPPQRLLKAKQAAEHGSRVSPTASSNRQMKRFGLRPSCAVTSDIERRWYPAWN